MTRNDAYKAAKRAWRQWHKRGCRPFGDAVQNTAMQLAAQGYTSRDIRLVRCWVKAFASGRRYPTEQQLQTAERAD